MGKRFINAFGAVIIPIAMLILVTACGGGDGDSSDDDSNNNSANETVISETTTQTSLTITDDEVLVAPDGYSLTMTVDGVETPMDTGTYTGNIVLTVTEEIPVTYRTLDTVYWRTAVYVEDGEYVPEKSVEAAWGGGTVTDTVATDLDITSVGKNFNGIVVTGNSTYTIDDPVIDFTGNGGNDFSGYGAGIVSKGTSNVTVNRAEIITNGAVRTAVFVGGDSIMHVNDSSIEVYNGTLPDDYVTNTTLGKMMEVPWMLGLVGNCRATNLVDNGTAYYNNTKIWAEGWGCLSTDDTESVRLYATDCTIETDISGYGAYSIGDSIDTFSNCEVNVADMAMILCSGGKGIFNQGTVVNSGRFGVMAHGGSGILEIEDSTFNTDSTVIQFKSSSGTITVDNSNLNPNFHNDYERSIILQAMVNDDPNMPGGSSVGDLNVAFSNMTMTGDIVNAAKGKVNTTLTNATITGAITTATATSGCTISQATYYNIGEVTNTYGTTDYAMTVFLDGDSEWIVDTTSYLTGLILESGSTVTAPDGHTVTMTVDGDTRAITAGIHTGEIILTVN